MNAFEVTSYENRLLVANEEYMPTQEELMDALQNSVFPSPPSSRESSREPFREPSRESSRSPPRQPERQPSGSPPGLPEPEGLPALQMQTGAAARFMSIGMSLQHTLDTCLAEAFGGIRNRLLCLETALTLKRPDGAALQQERRQAEMQAAFERSQEEMRVLYERRHDELRAAFQLRQEEMRVWQEEMRAALKENARPVSPNCVADEIEPDNELRQKVLLLERANARLGTRVDELEREIKKKQRT